jgi:hypothetical protein
MTIMENRPGESEYASYYSNYVSLVPTGDIEYILSEQISESISLIKNLFESQGQFRYASGKWSIKEVIGHLCDTERIMAYRLLCIARGEVGLLPGFDENEYVVNASFEKQTIPELLDHFVNVRQSTLYLLKSLSEDAWLRRGMANGLEVSVRAIAYIIAGHERHHRQIIIDRYFNSEAYPSN